MTWQAEGTYNFTGTSLENLGLFAYFAYGVNTEYPLTYHSLDQYNLTDGSEFYTLNLGFTPGVDSFITIAEYVGGWLDPYNFQTATADFSNTAIVQVFLPEGATFTSDSGVFLTQTTPIPLPGAVWLLGSGLLGLAGWRKFRKS